MVKDRPGHDLRYCLDSSKIEKELKWKYESSFEERLKETIFWYTKKFRSNFFKNLVSQNIQKFPRYFPKNSI